MMKTRLAMLVSILVVVAAYGGNSRAVAKTYYVSTSGDDSADGLAEKTSFRTITHAATQAQAGDTVYIKGGNYGHKDVVISNSGTADQPIIFQGYKDKPGDTPAPDEMPLLDGQDGKPLFGIQIRNKSHLSIANIAITRYKVGFYVSGPDASHIALRNITAYLNYHGILFENGPTAGGNHNTIVDCTAYNNDMCNFSLRGCWTNCLIDNCKSYNREGLGNYTDYFYAMTNGANHNTIKNCIAGGYPKSKHHCSGHGYAFRHNASHNKVINCRSYNTGCEHYKVSENSNYNEFVNCIGAGTHRPDVKVAYTVGFNMKSSHNKVVNCVAQGVYHGISLYWSKAEPSRRPITGNLFENNILVSNTRGINFSKDGVDGKKNIAKYNNVWDNKVNYQNCSPGVGDISEDPRFVNPAAYDFHLKSRYGRWDGKKWVKDKATSPCIDAGDPKSKWKNESAPNGGRINIGAYGNTSKASKSASTTPARKGR
jgi:hypothetical protein